MAKTSIRAPFRRKQAQAEAFYRNIPVVNLLPAATRNPAAALGKFNQRVAIRLALLTAVLLLALAAQWLWRSDASNQAKIEDAAIAFSLAQGLDGERTDLQLEVDALRAAASVPTMDYAFLDAYPEALVPAMSHVLSTNVTGITVLSISASAENELAVRFEAADNFAVLTWGGAMTASDAIDRVVSVRPVVGSSPTEYDALLVVQSEPAQ
jgi:hypothetical protein